MPHSINGSTNTITITILYYTTTHIHNLSRFSDVMCNGVRRAASATIDHACRPESPELEFPLRQIEFLRKDKGKRSRQASMYGKKKARENPHREDGRQSPVISCRYIPIVAHEKNKKANEKLTNGHKSQHINLIKTYMPYVPSHAGCQAGEEG
ncbi:hypothetical protein BO79DRAFT_233786 [Aspergillus costaricaensis CBS 115574]|uniref:Uncharacterized protein n=1 Tax=Aspergillus costaricaensis CBS 115574 TaxID=1448317 RepID=A0ACD1HY85_9EURO|nr:hypothetical protein BO79DRAFT_233786 [Aspergillus costaricaensis CBS 115574]RAK82932.1 hypothetical protein BO79DRAFT_233786 [Aspergillus costaricaensis CBS 115574]